MQQDEENRSLLSDYESLLGDLQHEIADITLANDGVTPSAPRLLSLASPLDMQGISSNQLGIMKSKEWIVRWSGKEIFKVREVVESTVDFISRCAGVVGQAVAYAPTPAAPAWAGVCVLLSVSRIASASRGALLNVELATSDLRLTRTTADLVRY